MSNIFTKFNKSGSPFNFRMPEKTEFVRPKDLFVLQEQTNGFDGYQMRTCFINKESKYGSHPVAGILVDGKPYWLDVPSHLTDTFLTIMSETEFIDAVNEGRCWLAVRRFYSRKYNKDGYDIEFLDK